MKPQHIIPTVLLSILLFISFIYLCQRKENNTVQTQSDLRNELKQKDSIIIANNKESALKTLKMNNYKQRAEEAEKLAEYYKNKPPKPPAPEIPDTLKAEYFDSTYCSVDTTKVKVNLCAVAEAIVQYFDLDYCEKESSRKDSVNKYLGIALNELDSAFFECVEKNKIDSNTIAVCMSKDATFEALIQAETQEGRVKFWKGMGVGGAVGLVLGMLIK